MAANKDGILFYKEKNSYLCWTLLQVLMLWWEGYASQQQKKKCWADLGSIWKHLPHIMAQIHLILKHDDSFQAGIWLVDKKFNIVLDSQFMPQHG